MKTKIEMAHEYAIALINSDCEMQFDKFIRLCWNYADAMQAEADKRLSEVECKEDWQPDWSQAPNRAMYWAMDGCGQCNWYEREPEVYGSQWDFGGVIEQADTGYDYQGDWRESLRKRPN